MGREGKGREGLVQRCNQRPTAVATAPPARDAVQERSGLGELLSALPLCDGNGLQQVMRIDVHRIWAPRAKVSVVPDALNVRVRIRALCRGSRVTRNQCLLKLGTNAVPKLSNDADFFVELVSLGNQRAKRSLVALECLRQAGDRQPRRLLLRQVGRRGER